MKVPGSNLLNMALKVISKEPGFLLRSTGRTKNSIGNYVTTYAPPEIFYASFQPVSAEKYEALGLDFDKNYVMVYSSTLIKDVQRGESGDNMTWGGKRYNFVSNNDWKFVDGWNGLMAVELGAA